jgi:hypothetical protein
VFAVHFEVWLFHHAAFLIFLVPLGLYSLKAFLWLSVAPCFVQLDSDILAAHVIKFQTTNITYKLHYTKAEFSATITAISDEVVELNFGGSVGKVEAPDVLIGL